MKSWVFTIISLIFMTDSLAQNCQNKYCQELMSSSTLEELVSFIHIDSMIFKKDDEYMLLIEYGEMGHIVHMIENIGCNVLIKKIVRSKIVQVKIAPGHVFMSEIRPGAFIIISQAYRRYSVEWIFIKNKHGIFEIIPEVSDFSEIMSCLQDHKPFLHSLALKALAYRAIMEESLKK
jgi:hypothetical protein